MTYGRRAFTWADLLLILALSMLGAGVGTFAERCAQRAMTARMPNAAAFQDSAHVPRLERALSAARDDRNAITAQLRELRLRQMRDSVALTLTNADLMTSGSAMPAANTGADSLRRERIHLQRLLRTDATLAAQLRTEAARIEDSVNAFQRAADTARENAARHYREAQRDFVLTRAGWTAAGTIAAAALLFGMTAFALRPRQGKKQVVQRGRDISIAAAFTALVLAQQLIGTPATLLLIAAIGLLVLLPHMAHAS